MNDELFIVLLLIIIVFLFLFCMIVGDLLGWGYSIEIQDCNTIIECLKD